MRQGIPAQGHSRHSSCKEPVPLRRGPLQALSRGRDPAQPQQTGASTTDQNGPEAGKGLGQGLSPRGGEINMDSCIGL